MDDNKTNPGLAEVFKPTVDRNKSSEKPETEQKPVNPLQAYFRKPAIYIKLPSGGKFNTPDEIDMPENGEIPVYPMTAKDEIMMRTPDALMNGATTVEVIQSCVPAIKNAWQISALDIDMILISIRIATYGETTEVKGVCPKCRTENVYELDLRNITDKVSTPDFRPVLEIDDLTLHFRPLTYQVATKESLKNFEQQRMIQSISNSELDEQERIEKFQDAFLRLTVYSVGILAETVSKVVMPDGTEVTDQDQIAEFVANADRTIFNKIKEHLDATKNSTTIEPIQFECTGETDLEGNNTPCDQKWSQPFTIDNSTFFG